jgi:integrase
VSKFSPSLQVAATLPKDTPSFADLLQRLEGADLPPMRKRDFASALRRVAEAISIPTDQCFAHSHWLQPRISAVSPAALGISPKTWSNVLSDLRGAIATLDQAKPRVNRRKDLSPDWRRLFEELVEADRTFVRFALSGFVFFLSRIGVPPAEVSNEDALSYRDSLVATQLRKDPEETYRKAVLSWNRAAAAHPFWPQQHLSAQSRQRRIRPDKREFPESFQPDLDAYLRSLSKPDLFTEHMLVRPRRAATIKAHENGLMLFAGALIRSGVPASELTSLALLVVPAHVKRGLTWLFDENGGNPRQSHVGLIYTLLSVARQHVVADEAEIKELERFAAKLKKLFPRRRGMTEKNLERIRAFRDKETLAKLLNLPERLFERGMASHGAKGREILLRDAVMLAFLRHLPIRRKNLLGIRLDEHIQRLRDGTAYLVVRASETKARKLIEFEIPPGLLSMIDTYITHRPASPWLFPGRNGDKPLDPQYVSTRVPKLVMREVGAVMNVHLARHLAAFMFLDARAGHYEEVRRLLGHSSKGTTLDAYASFETDSVGRRYSELIEEKREQSFKKGRR